MTPSARASTSLTTASAPTTTEHRMDPGFGIHPMLDPKHNLHRPAEEFRTSGDASTKPSRGSKEKPRSKRPGLFLFTNDHAALMAHRLGEHIHHDDAQDDQPEADDRGQVEGLLEPDPPDGGDQNDADSGPDRIGNPRRDGPQRQREK